MFKIKSEERCVLSRQGKKIPKLDKKQERSIPTFFLSFFLNIYIFKTEKAFWINNYMITVLLL